MTPMLPLSKTHHRSTPRRQDCYACSEKFCTAHLSCDDHKCTSYKVRGNPTEPERATGGAHRPSP